MSADIIDIFLCFKKYLLSFIQSTMFTGRMARQTNRLYALRMIVKLAYYFELARVRVIGSQL